ncbi:hypothetical protein NL676_035751 [Syzygium grande]|nr:hypothetical protein NL676_035751 [Syzygium grande]
MVCPLRAAMLGLLALGTIAGSIKRANGAVPPSSMRFGDGPNDKLSLESNGDYTREGYLAFANYNNVSPNGFETRGLCELFNLATNLKNSGESKRGGYYILFVDNQAYKMKRNQSSTPAKRY